MATVRLTAGATLDLLNKDELDKSLQDQYDREWTDRARGIKPLQFAGAPQKSISATAGYTISATPNEGYIWSLRLLAAGLAASGTAAFWIGSDTSTGLPSPNGLPPLESGSAGIISSATFGKGQAFLRPSQYVVVSAAAAATLNSYLMVVVEVPAELIWKVC